jgi:membrane associated rhomboid family serine protease
LVDLNHIFLFLALISPLAVLARSWRSGGGDVAWRIAAGVVLGITGLSWVFAHNQAGYIGAGAWFALLFLPAMGLRRMTELAARREYTAARRLAATLQWLHPSAELRDQIRVLRHLEDRKLAGNLPQAAFPAGHPLNRDRNPFRNSRAVIFLIAANCLVFGVELYATATSPNEVDVLLRLGALEPALVFFSHQYWRLFAALFLHAGIVHLLFNLFALYVLGPQLERSIGSVRFLACYLLSGLCSSAGVVLLWRFGWIIEGEVVGASGCVMGIVGAWAAFLIRNHQTPLVRRRLTNVLMIVVIQTIFDLTTPQVSMSAHLCGLAGGFLVGLGLAPSSRAERRKLYRADLT